MKPTVGIVAAVVLVGCLAVLTGPAAAAVVENADGGVDEAGNDSDEAGFGSAVSEFVHGTEASAGGAVEQGLWKERVGENASAGQVENRSGDLAERVVELRERRVELAEAYENGSIPVGQYRAMDAQIRGELRAISAAANDTRSVAERAGVPDAGVDAVAEAAAEARGPPEEVRDRRGPPDDLPHADNDTDPGPPEDAPGGTQTDDGTGPSGDPPAGNETGSGSPGDGADDADGGSSSGHGPDGNSGTGPHADDGSVPALPS